MRRRRAREKAAQAGTEAPAHTGKLVDGEPPVRLRKIDDALTAAELAIRLVLEDPQADSVSKARVLLTAAAMVGKTLEAGEFAARLDELEKRLSGKTAA
jgi:hypothetical protein